VVRLHGLDVDNVVYVQQNPDLIDQGVFHNDVIAVGNQNVLFYHEQAFYQSSQSIAEIKQKFVGDDLHLICVKTEEVSVQDAIKSYLFNTQIITLANGDMAIIAPTDCKENTAVSTYLTNLVAQNTPIKHVYYHDVKESMRNGGGPACLRLRVAMTDKEHAAVNQSTLINDRQFERLNAWVDKHYRDTLHVDDLSDPQLLIESRTALDELTQLLNLGSVYPFQQI
jgi:succinylarginine dihydrolase